MGVVINFPQQTTARPVYWRPIEAAPRDGTLMKVLVPAGAGGMVEGRAYFDPNAYGGTWWWEGTSRADYHHDPIEECNHGAPLFFCALEARP